MSLVLLAADQAVEAAAADWEPAGLLQVAAPGEEQQDESEEPVAVMAGRWVQGLAAGLGRAAAAAAVGVEAAGQGTDRILAFVLGVDLEPPAGDLEGLALDLEAVAGGSLVLPACDLGEAADDLEPADDLVSADDLGAVGDLAFDLELPLLALEHPASAVAVELASTCKRVCGNVGHRFDLSSASTLLPFAMTLYSLACTEAVVVLVDLGMEAFDLEMQVEPELVAVRTGLVALKHEACPCLDAAEPSEGCTVVAAAAEGEGVGLVAVQAGLHILGVVGNCSWVVAGVGPGGSAA